MLFVHVHAADAGIHSVPVGLPHSVPELALNPSPALMEADQVVICCSWRGTSELRQAGSAIRKRVWGRGPAFVLRGGGATQDDSGCHGSETKQQSRSFVRQQISGAPNKLYKHITLHDTVQLLFRWQSETPLWGFNNTVKLNTALITAGRDEIFKKKKNRVKAINTFQYWRCFVPWTC